MCSSEKRSEHGRKAAKREICGVGFGCVADAAEGWVMGFLKMLWFEYSVELDQDPELS